MAISTVFSSLQILIVASFLIGIALPTVVLGQENNPSPAPAPISDGTTIDQGIAYLLMLVALVLTYLIHPLDASSSYKLL